MKCKAVSNHFFHHTVYITLSVTIISLSHHLPLSVCYGNDKRSSILCLVFVRNAHLSQQHLSLLFHILYADIDTCY